ncbi:SDR family oxidoreductase [Streptomyces sp. RLB3-17]|nr:MULTISPECIES: SDR family oxidoreductase [unclassified Streptomyces]QDO03078.1 SDR family oxidoreductase [Streptomyces sp. RLB1-9]QDO24811.1 SDR family oxidoreductase [Streptomyces sp. S1A1-8]QDO34931.1 SDR family oxidoreductase [Streptomyces sp. S1A1-3]QDO44949.1 SDR family oxidoreductase [Streptomyces sp. RLB3-17]
MLDSLGGKTALVTGAGQGIGRAIAVEMARQGASAVAVADRNAQDHDRAVDSLSEEVWDAVYQVNLKAAWQTTKFAAPYLRRSPRGPAIVNAVDLSPVRCNCFCPGVIDTPLARGHFAAGEDRDARERKMTAPQLVDRPGRPEEVARLACFLASDSAAFITGAAYVIDGGALAWRGVKG